MLSPKVKVGIAVAIGAGIAYYLWKRGGTLTRPACGPGYAWHVATPDELSNITRYSLAMQQQLKNYGGYCAARGDVSEPTIVDGPILYPSQV